MKLGEIKIEALKLMFAGYGDELTVDNLEDYLTDENYKNYLVNMPGAINRCFSVLEHKKVIPVRSAPLSMEQAEEVHGRLRFDLKEQIKDFHALERVVIDGNYGYESAQAYSMEAGVLVLSAEEIEDDAVIRVLYRPKLARLTFASGDHADIDLPDDIACHIPCFIKGDLYRDDEPDEAGEARNFFEAAMEEIKRNEMPEQVQSTVVHRMGAWMN
ncbi:MAG: hypothetical protein IJ344_01390 [Clostridia bacterium]|nr:hypothetical protein [Clostridia bacterium]